MSDKEIDLFIRLFVYKLTIGCVFAYRAILLFATLRVSSKRQSRRDRSITRATPKVNRDTLEEHLDDLAEEHVRSEISRREIFRRESREREL